MDLAPVADTVSVECGQDEVENDISVDQEAVEHTASNSADKISAADTNLEPLAVREDHLGGNRYFRTRIIRTDTKYPYLRVEEEYEVDEAAGSERILDRVEMVADHMLVKIAGNDSKGLLEALNEKYGFTIIRKTAAPGLFIVHIGAHGLDSLPEAIEAYTEEKGIVIYAEPDYVVEAASLFPNDHQFDRLWAMHNTGAGSRTEDLDIDAAEAWERRTDAGNIVVGVIDTGIDCEHEDLAANMWVNPGEIAGNGIDDDGNGYIDDINGWDFANDDNDPYDDHFHGTHCAGILGAVGNNATGVVGVCWSVKLVALKFLRGVDGKGLTSDAIDAVYYATAIGADLTSNSWGGGGYTISLLNAIRDAAAHNMLFVAAAGNDGRNLDSNPYYPACYDSSNVITVASVSYWNKMATDSNFGGRTVDLAAPGASILSTMPMRFGEEDKYASKSGTSMATPHVSGACALYKAEHPDASLMEIKNAIMNSVVVIDYLVGRVISHGMLNVNDMMTASPASGSQPVISPDRGPYEGELEVTITSEDDDVDIHYTLDGTMPDISSPVYAGPIAVTNDVIVKARAFRGGASCSMPAAMEYFFPGTRFYEFDLDEDPGWTREGIWEYGVPLGGGGWAATDPESGKTGNNVYGCNLAGYYPHNMPDTQWLTAGPFDCTDRYKVSLGFWRWLGVQYFADRAYIEVSTDGVEWEEVWENDKQYDDGAWVYEVVDISECANNQETVYVRWGLGRTDDEDAFCGWNIDDVSLWAKYGPESQPSPPTDVVVVAYADARVYIGWTDNHDDETGYIVERSEDGGPWVRKRDCDADTEYITDNNIVMGRTYQYRIATMSEAGHSEYVLSECIEIAGQYGDDWDSADNNRDRATVLDMDVAFGSHGTHTLSSWDREDIFRLELIGGATYIFHTRGGVGDVRAALYEDWNEFAPFMSDDDSGGNGQFEIIFTPENSGIFYLVVSTRSGGRPSSYNLNYSVAGRGLVFTNMVGSYDVAVGENLEISVETFDPSGVAPSLYMSFRPAGADFDDNGDGTGSFAWMPLSTNDVGIHTARFVAESGVFSCTNDVEIDVGLPGGGAPAAVTNVSLPWLSILLLDDE